MLLSLWIILEIYAFFPSCYLSSNDICNNNHISYIHSGFCLHNTYISCIRKYAKGSVLVWTRIFYLTSNLTNEQHLQKPIEYKIITQLTFTIDHLIYRNTFHNGYIDTVMNKEHELDEFFSSRIKPQ
jgi:hypothetical protein